jgi:hypothetical protein
MALTAKSLMLFGLEITELNSSIDFKISGAGAELQATIDLGFYSLTSLLEAIRGAMQVADPANTYTVSADRTTLGGTENRVTIATDGIYLDLLFGTGTRAASTIAPLIGFTSTDQTGSLSYTGTSTAGTALVPTYEGYNYLPSENYKKVFGSVNVSSSGKKESIVFDIQDFIQVEFKHEAQARIAPEWAPFWAWAIQQKPFDFTPEITSPTVFKEVTLEQTPGDGKGLGYIMREELPQFPFLYGTGLIKLREVN